MKFEFFKIELTNTLRGHGHEFIYLCAYECVNLNLTNSKILGHNTNINEFWQQVLGPSVECDNAYEFYNQIQNKILSIDIVSISYLLPHIIVSMEYFAAYITSESFRFVKVTLTMIIESLHGGEGFRTEITLMWSG